jgi:hypothetical protein
MMTALAGAGAAHAQDRMLVDATPWTAGASEGVQSTATATAGGARLSYTVPGAGYAFMTHALSFSAPANFDIDVPIDVSGDGNDLQIKFDDASGDNVWWVVRPAVKAGRQVLHIRPRHIQFAWGPIADKRFTGGVKLEIVMVKTAKGAASGSVTVGPIAWHEEPSPPAVEAPLKADRAAIVDANIKTVWTGKAGDTATLDLSRVRDFGGIQATWATGAHSYEVSTSSDNATWSAPKTVVSTRMVDLVPLGEVDARYVRLTLKGGAGLAEVTLLPLAEGIDRNALLKHAAALAAKGDYPRAYIGQQSYWTLIGVPGGGARSSLLSEDGAVELGAQGPSLEPFLAVDGKAIAWSGATIAQGLTDARPWVKWTVPGVTLTVGADASGPGAHPMATVRYAVRNTSRKAKDVRLDLDLRPMQVNPPAQFLTRPGGFSPVTDLVMGADAAKVGGRVVLTPLTPPDRRAAWTWYAMGPGADDHVHDDDGLASGVYGYTLHLKPGETREVELSYPLADGATGEGTAPASGDTVLTLPAGTPPIADSLAVAEAYILKLKDGDFLKPGARSYDRSWIRDGAMMSESLMRLGRIDDAAAYFKAYAPYVFPSGKVPCCVDARGADPTPENDSMGEFAWLAGELVRYGWSPDEARPYWPQVKAALAYQEQLRQSTRTSANRQPATRNLYGLLPPSISHEGYSDKPAYSYWDDFWALKGYRGGVILATALGHTADAAALQGEADQFATELKASLSATAELHHLKTLAGAADRGDFDPTSSTMGLTAGAHGDDVPADLARNTWDQYWKEIVARQTRPASYVPYELRNVAVFLRLNEPERARRALDWMFKDQAPQAWRQWGEVVAVPYRNPTFLGDLPHGWVESDYIRSALDLFAYERPDTRQMVLLAGFDPHWATLGETRLSRLHTPYGTLDLSVGGAKGHLVLHYTASSVPPGGFVVNVAALGGVDATTDRHDAHVNDNGELILNAAAATVDITLATPSRPKP